jgi:hypothetical protein
MDRELLQAVGEKNILDEFQQARFAFGATIKNILRRSIFD